ncbi:MAG: RnfABCDGE type electron transport complex subunit B [Halofilum sp. (in: g-proteobacteria)]
MHNDVSQPNAPTLTDRIDALLPQTQCTQCGYDGCRPYAEAIAAGEADINRCPPGGDDGIRALAELLGLSPKAMDPECGEPVTHPVVAVIDESVCIGCTKCIQACPVDAIVGAAQQMHTMIASECTGCELCIPPCPVDCISLEPAPDPTPLRERADQFRARYYARNERLERRRREREAARASKRPDGDRENRRAEVAAAVERARAKRRRAADRR